METKKSKGGSNNIAGETPAYPSQKPKANRLGAWWNSCADKVGKARKAVKARKARLREQYEELHRKQEFYGADEVESSPKNEPPKRITIVTAIRILLAELGEAEYWRTIGHLIWRPGYIINDYLNGKRRNYLRPFNLLIGTTILFGIIMMIVPAKREQRQTIEEIFDEVQIKVESGGETIPQDKLEGIQTFIQHWDAYRQWKDEHMAPSLLLQSIGAILMTWLLFRKSPRKGCPFIAPDQKVTYNLAEIVTAQIFILSQLQMVNTVWVLVAGWFVPTFSLHPYAFPNILTYAILVIDYKQLFGRTWGSTIWRTLFCVIW